MILISVPVWIALPGRVCLERSSFYADCLVPCETGFAKFLTIAVLLTSIFVQWQNQVKHAELWTISKDYWQQMMWRAPSLKEYTTIVTEDALLVEEDYDVFAPASMIYFPHEDAWSPIGAEVLNRKTTADILLGNNSGRYVREIYTPKDYDHLLAVSKPTVDGCLRIIDGSVPLYSARDYTRIPQRSMFSRLSQIITEPETMPDYPFFLGKEQEHGWCYYFEKMELALQMADPLAASKLADEAVSKNLKAIDPVEWVPRLRHIRLPEERMTRWKLSRRCSLMRLLNTKSAAISVLKGTRKIMLKSSLSFAAGS